jgi:hypothetical protein
MQWDWYTPDPKVIKTIRRRAAHVADVGNMQVWRSQQGFSRLIKEEGGKVFMSTIEFWSITEAVREANTRL